MIPLIILGLCFVYICIMVTKTLLENSEDELAVFNALAFAIMMFLLILFVISSKQRQDDSRFERIEEPVYRLK